MVTWRRAQIVLLSAQGMGPPKISEVVFTDPDTVHEVIHNFNRNSYEALSSSDYRDSRPPDLHTAQAPRDKTNNSSQTRPTSASRFQPSHWPSLADYIVAEGMMTNISLQGLEAASCARRQSAFVG